MTTPCVHDEPKSQIMIIMDGIKHDLLSCKNCTEKIESFSTIQVVSQ